MDAPVEDSVGGGEMPTGQRRPARRPAQRCRRGGAGRAVRSRRGAGILGCAAASATGAVTRPSRVVLAIDRYIDSDGSEVVREQLLEVRSRLREP